MQFGSKPQFLSRWSCFICSLGQNRNFLADRAIFFAVWILLLDGNAAEGDLANLRFGNLLFEVLRFSARKRVRFVKILRKCEVCHFKSSSRKAAPLRKPLYFNTFATQAMPLTLSRRSKSSQNRNFFADGTVFFAVWIKTAIS